MKKIQRESLKEIEKSLESDDEFPDNYFENPEIPVYLNDNRFEEIKFGWINYDDLNKHTNVIQNLEPNDKLQVLETTHSVPIKPILKVTKGVLSRHDIFCLKSVENDVGDDTLIWFLNFLLFKESQSNFKFLKSCLVNEFLNNVFLKEKRNIKNCKDIIHEPKQKYRIIIK